MWKKIYIKLKMFFFLLGALPARFVVKSSLGKFINVEINFR
jgi:hypothetical protein